MEKSTLSLLEKLQESLKNYIELDNKINKIDTIAGADSSFSKNLSKICVCILDYQTLKIREKIVIEERITFHYKSGFLCFTEGPLILDAISNLKSSFDCLLVDGNGILHPRMMGLATFLGIILKKPTIGVAKTLLLGSYSKLAKVKGSFSYIKYKNKILGMALRTKTDTKEVYVSCGWGVSLEKAKQIVLDTSVYRIPEPLRVAHIYSKI